MGYRALLKRYLLHVETLAGDTYIEADASEPVLSKRDLGELRTIAAELKREHATGNDSGDVPNYNYRLRLLLTRNGLAPSKAAERAGLDRPLVESWCEPPAAPTYRAMTAEEFEHITRRLDQDQTAPA